jgi:hypothetical protein
MPNSGARTKGGTASLRIEDPIATVYPVALCNADRWLNDALFFSLRDHDPRVAARSAIEDRAQVDNERPAAVI